MGRIIGSVIVGYLTMFVATFVLFSVAYLILGASGSFRPGAWDPSVTWIIMSVVASIATAIAGGYVCAAIAKSPRGPQALVAVVIVLGLVSALPVVTGSGAELVGAARPETVTMFDAMQNARQPVWLALLFPLLGAVGVLIGARLYRPGRSQTAAM